MSLLVWIIGFSLLGGVLSVVAASSFLLLSESNRTRIMPHGVSFAVGALLTVSFWGLIPHAFEAVTPDRIPILSATILVGILFFFILEKLLLWRHCHTDECEAHLPHDGSNKAVAGSLILVGDSIHNFVDGVLIAAAFLSDIKLGIATSLAVAAHEIPQEVGDFAIFLHCGYSRFKAFSYNIIASLATVVGAVLAYFVFDDLNTILPYILVLAAASFIYIAVADLIPNLHKKTDFSATLQQITAISAGVALIAVMHGLME